MAIAGNMASTRSFLFCLTRLRATYLNSTQHYMPATICPKFLKIQAKSQFTASCNPCRSNISMQMHIVHIIHICAYLQVRGLLDTLQLLASAEGEGHLRMYSTLLIGHTTYAGEQRVACWPFKGKTLQKSNRQDLVFVRPPGIDKGCFQLRIDNIWFCRVLFLFSFESRNDQGIKRHDCAFVSVLEEYNGVRRPGCDAYSAYCCFICILSHILHILSGWLARANSTMIYERKSNKQVLYVLPITSILGKLPGPLVPVGDTGTIPHGMSGESADFDGA